MKSIHTSTLDVLFTNFSYEIAAEVTDNALEVFEGNFSALYADLVDFLMDYVSKEEAERISELAVDAVA